MAFNKEVFSKKITIQVNILAQIYEFVKSFDVNSQNINELEVRRENLSTIEDKFEEIQQKLEEKASEDDSEEEVRIRFENMLFETRFLLKERLKFNNNTVKESQVRLPKIDLPKFSGDILC